MQKLETLRNVRNPSLLSFIGRRLGIAQYRETSATREGSRAPHDGREGGRSERASP